MQPSKIKIQKMTLFRATSVALPLLLLTEFLTCLSCFLGLLFIPEDGSSTFLQNIAIFLWDCAPIIPGDSTNKHSHDSKFSLYLGGTQFKLYLKQLLLRRSSILCLERDLYHFLIDHFKRIKLWDFRFSRRRLSPGVWYCTICWKLHLSDYTVSFSTLPQ
jgi:hypothetical protein